MTTKSKTTKRIRKAASRGVILTTYNGALISRESLLQVKLIIGFLLSRNSDRLIDEVFASLLTPNARKSRRKQAALTTISSTDAGPNERLWTFLDRNAYELMQELGLK